MNIETGRVNTIKAEYGVNQAVGLYARNNDITPDEMLSEMRFFMPYAEHMRVVLSQRLARLLLDRGGNPDYRQNALMGISLLSQVLHMGDIGAK